MLDSSGSFCNYFKVHKSRISSYRKQNVQVKLKKRRKTGGFSGTVSVFRSIFTMD